MRLPRLWGGRRARLMAYLIANGVAQAAIAIAVAMLVRLTFDRATVGGKDPSEWSLTQLMALLGAALVLALVLRVVERVHAARLGEAYVTRIRLRLFAALAADPTAATQRRGLGPTMLRFVTDLTAVRRWISEGLARGIVGSLATVGGIAALCLISPAMGSAAGAAALAALIAGVGLKAPLARRVSTARRQRARLAAHIGDRLLALDVVKASGRERRERRRLGRNSARLAETAVARARVAAVVQILPDVALGAATLAILVIGALKVPSGDITHGTVVAALSLIGAIAPQARALGRAFEHWTNYRVATVKLKQILRTAPAARGPRRRMAPPKGHLVLENVTVASRLDAVDATVSAGARIALIGPSGSGKAALLSAAAGRLRPDEGRILLDGSDLAEIDARSFARHVGIALPDLPLVKGSLRKNLCYRHRRATEAEVAAACRLCGLEDAIAALPSGLDHRVTDQAANLPRDMRQRLVLARAVIGEPALLLLDERELAGTPDGCATIERVLAARRGTTLIVTSSPERARNADVLWYLEDGFLREAGPPDAILAAQGRAAHFLNTLAPGAGGASPGTVIRLDPMRPQPVTAGCGARPSSYRRT